MLFNNFRQALTHSSRRKVCFKIESMQFNNKDNLIGYNDECHRIDRVLSFSSSRPNWYFPTPSHAGGCVPPPPPLWFRGSILARGGEGVGESRVGRGDRHFGTLGVYVLCDECYSMIHTGRRFKPPSPLRADFF